MENGALLRNWLQEQVDYHFPLHSRIHPMNSFRRLHSGIFLKREDELAGHGSKMRKYASLIPFLKRKGFREVIVIGGANSNHVVQVSQLLIQNRIKPILFLKKTHSGTHKGNSLLIRLLVPESQIQWLNRIEWLEVKKIASEYAIERREQGFPCYLLDEGACDPNALAGSMTL
ncbi:MAG: hypothetical protein NZ108_03495, partial [Bacteroidia bacterium]|nr:hypothetical protein [Bacteroidia bacterium]